jgi:cytochrome c-type biogenesis protein CcmI
VFYLAAILIVTGVALYVAAPLASETSTIRAPRGGNTAFTELEHGRALTMQALAELEFDREMGKLSAADYDLLRRNLEERALSIMEQIEQQREQQQAPAARTARAVAAAAPERRSRSIRFCPQCGAAVGSGHKFCATCGTSLAVAVDSVREAG